MATLGMYHALLTLAENNMRVIHWKLIGTDFHEAHARYGEYYEQLGVFMDETAEQMITLGYTPMNMSNALVLLGKDTGVHATIMNPELSYTSMVADKVTKKMFDELYDFAAHLAVDAAIPSDVQDVFMNQAKWFRITSIYKLDRATDYTTGYSEKSKETEEAAPATKPEGEVQNEEFDPNATTIVDRAKQNWKPLNEDQPEDEADDMVNDEVEPLDDGGEKLDDNEAMSDITEPMTDDE